MQQCELSSGYEPSSLVSGFHAIPHVDIDLRSTPSTFPVQNFTSEESMSYFQAVIVWACVPILVVLCAFILMSVYFICICCFCCFQQHKKRSTCSKATCGTLITLLIVLCLALIGVGFWAEFELDRRINDFTTSASNANNIVSDVQTQAGSYDSDALSTDLSQLTAAVQGLNNVTEMAIDALEMANVELNSVFQDIESRSALVSLTPVLDSVDFIELVRHWSVYAFLIAIALVLILMAVSVCCSAACSNPTCTVITLFIFSLFTILTWVAVGGNLAFLVISSDVCFDPDNLIRNATEVDSSTVPPDVLNYYLVCNETCLSSPFQQSLDNATKTFETVVSGALNITNSFVNNNPQLNLLELTMDIDTRLQNAESAINNLTMLSNCTLLNSDYLAILDSYCDDGILYTVILFGVVCGLALGMLMIVICATCYAGLLSSGKEYDEETVVYDFPDSNSSPWDSYGNRQNFSRPTGQYTQFTESLPLTPPPPNEPPKYTDLSRGGAVTSNMDNGDTGAGARAVSGDYDHFQT